MGCAGLFLSKWASDLLLPDTSLSPPPWEGGRGAPQRGVGTLLSRGSLLIRSLGRHWFPCLWDKMALAPLSRSLLSPALWNWNSALLQPVMWSCIPLAFPAEGCIGVPPFGVPGSMIPALLVLKYLITAWTPATGACHLDLWHWHQLFPIRTECGNR